MSKVNPLNHHYAFENPGSIYDEEALTALELCSRLGAKIMEIIKAHNDLDATIIARLDNQDKVILENVGKEVLKYIEAGRFDQALNEYVSNMVTVTPELFGAVGDGLADDTEAIRQAFSAGSNMVLMTGTYRVMGNITLNKDNLTVMGGKLILDDTVNEEFILDFSGNNILFDSVVFEHPSWYKATNPMACNGVRFMNCEDVTLRNCKFVSVNARINGILDFYLNWKNVTIENCHFIVNTFYDNTLHSGGVWVRDLYNGGGCENLHIHNCIFDSQSKDEILAIWNEDNFIRNVTVSDCEFNCEGMPHLCTLVADKVMVSGCKFISKAKNTILKLHFNDACALDVLVSGCEFFSDPEESSVIYRPVYTMENGIGPKVKNCVFKGTKFSSAFCTFYDCDIEATANLQGCDNGVHFYNCKIAVNQTKNQFVRNGAIFHNCDLTTTGYFTQLLGGGTIELSGCRIHSNDAYFIVNSSDTRKYIIMGCRFSGTMPNLYTMKATDVIMGNRFASSPNFNTSNAVLGKDTNVIG